MGNVEQVPIGILKVMLTDPGSKIKCFRERKLQQNHKENFDVKPGFWNKTSFSKTQLLQEFNEYRNRRFDSLRSGTGV